MKHSFRLVVTTGPERGKVFESDEELAHIGRAPENQIVLEDPSLSEHQASVLQKNGRFAIFRPADADVHVDGSEIPSERWVWLPTEVRLQFGRRTSCQFSTGELFEPAADSAPMPQNPPAEESSGNGETTAQAVPKKRKKEPGSKKSADSLPAVKPVQPLESERESKNGSAGDAAGERKRRKKKRKKQLARFITDQGDPLVELGADGQLPELSLEDGPASRSRSAKKKSTSPVILYCVLGLSFFCTLALLFIDPSPPTRTEVSRAQARKDIVAFYGTGEHELKPFQKALRAARLAHARGDTATERAEYRKVLDELNSEDRDRHIGVTGHHNTDKELRRLIGIIMSR